MFEVVSHILDRSNSFQVQFIPNIPPTHHRQHQNYFSLDALSSSLYPGWYRHDQLIKAICEKSDFMIGCSLPANCMSIYPNLTPIRFGVRSFFRRFRLILAFSDYEYTYMFSKMLGIAPH